MSLSVDGCLDVCFPFRPLRPPWHQWCRWWPPASLEERPIEAKGEAKKETNGSNYPRTLEFLIIFLGEGVGWSDDTCRWWRLIFFCLEGRISQWVNVQNRRLGLTPWWFLDGWFGCLLQKGLLQMSGEFLLADVFLDGWFGQLSKPWGRKFNMQMCLVLWFVAETVSVYFLLATSLFAVLMTFQFQTHVSLCTWRGQKVSEKNNVCF